MELKPQAISQHVLREKYLRENERCGADIYRRVARALASVEADPMVWEPRFLAALHGGFIPAGRILAAAGTELRATLMNCFVQPVGDSRVLSASVRNHLPLNRVSSLGGAEGRSGT